ncbi:MAG: methyltransferase domain-containing protein [Gemmataceae bacterium]
MTHIQTYDTRAEAYQRAFQVFLAHTDEKAVIHAWLANLIDRLPAREVFIDAGAGNGKLTARLQDSFRRTIAIEISDWLRSELALACPRAELIAQPILEACPGAAGDLVLCSHVLYYIPEDTWLAHLEKMASWLAPTGVLAILMQSADCDCTRLLEHFTGQRPDLKKLASMFRDRHGGSFEVALEREAASVVTPDLGSATIVAEFMLNLYPRKAPIARADVEAYLRATCARAQGGFLLSIDQDFLTIRPRG